jgi:hypothetical protein
MRSKDRLSHVVAQWRFAASERGKFSTCERFVDRFHARRPFHDERPGIVQSKCRVRDERGCRGSTTKRKGKSRRKQ